MQRNHRNAPHQEPAHAHILADGFDLDGGSVAFKSYEHREFQVEATILSLLPIGCPNSGVEYIHMRLVGLADAGIGSWPNFLQTYAPAIRRADGLTGDGSS